MGKRGPRPVVYVCVGIDQTKVDVVSKQIQATSQQEAARLFLEQTSIKAKTIHGPYRPKRAQVLENTRTLKFSDKSCKGVYNGWEVNIFYLKEPENHAYLVFIRKIDEQAPPAPKGTFLVPVSDLRSPNE
jgi:hypothetical protein